jgi:hypothetical protein
MTANMVIAGVAGPAPANLGFTVTNADTSNPDITTTGSW